MLALNNRTFLRAIQKAIAVRPSVTRDGSRYNVSRADGGKAIVRFTVRAGSIWASCSCPAGSPDGRNLPLPCYHVAAAVMASRFQPAPTEHRHSCALCNTPSVFSCICLTPNEPDYDCDCIDSVAGNHRDSDYWT